MLSTARSLDTSVPITAASSEVPSGAEAHNHAAVAVATTCALVTILPSVPIRNPVPEPSLVLTDTTAGLAVRVDGARHAAAALGLNRVLGDGGQRLVLFEEPRGTAARR